MNVGGVRPVRLAVINRLQTRLPPLAAAHVEPGVTVRAPVTYSTVEPLVPVDRFPAVFVGGDQLTVTTPDPEVGVHRSRYRLRVYLYDAGNNPTEVDAQIDVLAWLIRVALTVNPRVAPDVRVDVASLRESYSPLGELRSGGLVRGAVTTVDVDAAETMPPVAAGTADTVVPAVGQLPAP